MKERFWLAYFYIMWFLLLGGLYILIDANGYLFEVFYYDYKYIGQYMMLSAIPLAIIRWIVTGKHIWNRP